MNTKTFAQQARKILIKGVRDKLRFWGFESKGPAQEEPQPVSGGYLFRGQAYDDPSVPALWQSLRRAVNQKGLDTVVEEAAYTWFNRIMAIQILAKNGYEPAQLEFMEGGGRTPLILQRAQRGTYPFLNATEKTRLQSVVTDLARESEAFAILLIGYCHSHTLLQTVFGSIDDYTELLLPDDILAPEGFLSLLHSTDAISDEEYHKVELIGWLYQFYISEKKDEVFAGFKKNKKAEAADIPAATQIFTPNWIVKYMVQNTVGKIWLDLHPDSPLKADMKYLVEAPPKVQEHMEDATHHPSSPIPHSSLIKEVSNLKLLDPAAGSGHILVEGFDLLYDMYLAEYYPPEEAVESILRHNLFGLDIDKRAAQLAQFALLLKAASRHRDILKKGLRPHIYAMPEPRPFDRQEVLDFLGKDGLAYADKLLGALQLMQQAQNLGSIMQFDLPEVAVEYITKRWAHFQQAQDLNFHEKTLLPALHAYLPVLLILCRRYEAVVANPPYMGQKHMNTKLKEYVYLNFPRSKTDLMTVFIENNLNLLNNLGEMGVITLQSWMFLSSFEELRKKLIENNFIRGLIQIGYNTFPELNSKIAQGCAFIIKKGSSTYSKGIYFNLNDAQQTADKNLLFIKKKRSGEFHIVNQYRFFDIPGNPLSYWISEQLSGLFKNKKLEKYATIFQGMITGDNNKFVREWHEVSAKRIVFNLHNFISFQIDKTRWVPYNKGGATRKWYGNQENIVDFSQKGKNFTRGKHQFSDFFFKPCFSWSYISSLDIDTRYFPSGFIWDVSGSSAFPNKEEDIFYFMSVISSKVGCSILKILNPTLNFQVENIAVIPIVYPAVDLKRIIIAIVKSNISISQIDWDSHETSWDFQYSPLLNHQPNLRQAYEAWQAAVTQDFFQLHANEEELNRIFIDIYGLQDELTPEVPLKDTTILQEELSGKDLEALEPAFRAQGAAAVALPIQRAVVMQQLLSYLIGLCMGRYRLDKPGLHIAHPGPTAEEITAYSYNGHKVEIDEDAILPLMGTACEFPDDALQRVKHLLDIIWGADTRTDNINFLQDCLDSDLEKYLVKQFWKDHCRRYKKKPIYWLFSSPGGAFQALVYMHRMNAFTAERIRDKYLLPHIKHLRGKVQQMEGRSALLSSQEARQLDRLRKDLSECETYELQLKDVADRQIVFDLDDGVTENYKLFAGVVSPV